MAESKSTYSAFPINGHSEKSAKFDPFPINRLDGHLECAVARVRAFWCFLFHRRYRRAHIVGLFDCDCQCEKCGRLWMVN
jgi:hypothetical protein